MQSQTIASVYHIRIKGHLDESWSGWLGNLAITHETGGVTLLSGPVADQSALLGVLRRLHDLGLTMLSVTCTFHRN